MQALNADTFTMAWEHLSKNSCRYSYTGQLVNKSSHFCKQTHLANVQFYLTQDMKYIPEWEYLIRCIASVSSISEKKTMGSFLGAIWKSSKLLHRWNIQCKHHAKSRLNFDTKRCVKTYATQNLCQLFPRCKIIQQLIIAWSKIRVNRGRKGGFVALMKLSIDMLCSTTRIGQPLAFCTPWTYRSATLKHLHQFKYYTYLKLRLHSYKSTDMSAIRNIDSSYKFTSDGNQLVFGAERIANACKPASHERTSVDR